MLHGESVWAPYLIARGCVYFRCQGLGFGLGGKEVLGFVEAEAQDLSIQVVILISELVILLRRGTQATLDSHRDPLLCIHGLLTSPQPASCPPVCVTGQFRTPTDDQASAGFQGEEGWVLRSLGGLRRSYRPAQRARLPERTWLQTTPSSLGVGEPEEGPRKTLPTQSLLLQHWRLDRESDALGPGVAGQLISLAPPAVGLRSPALGSSSQRPLGSCVQPDPGDQPPLELWPQGP